MAWLRITLNPKKCKFFVLEVDILGFTRGTTGLCPSLDKIQAIQDFPVPESKEDLIKFLARLLFLSKLIPGRAELAVVIKGAVKNNSFKWGLKEQLAFKKAKRAVSENVLAAGDLNFQYHLSTDASGQGLGGALFQEVDDQTQWVMFLSYKLLPAETRYHNTEREALAVVKCLEEIRWLVMGSAFPVKVYTDHQALLSILKGDDAQGQIVQWQYRLAEFNLDIIHVPGKELIIADGLSRIRKAAPCITEATMNPMILSFAVRTQAAVMSLEEQLKSHEEEPVP